jgi:hypothetical protein
VSADEDDVRGIVGGEILFVRVHVRQRLRVRIHECPISLRFLGIIFRAHRLFFTSFKPLLLGGGGGETSGSGDGE